MSDFCDSLCFCARRDGERVAARRLYPTDGAALSRSRPFCSSACDMFFRIAFLFVFWPSCAAYVERRCESTLDDTLRGSWKLGCSPMTSYVHCISAVWMMSRPRCSLPYSVGAKLTLKVVPSEPAGASSPFAGATCSVYADSVEKYAW